MTWFSDPDITGSRRIFEKPGNRYTAGSIQSFEYLGAELDGIDLAILGPENITGGRDDDREGQGSGPFRGNRLGELVRVGARVQM